jgi:hypothetical protein
MVFALGFIAGVVALSLLAVLSGTNHQRKCHSWLIRVLYAWADFWYAFARASDGWIVSFRKSYSDAQGRIPLNELDDALIRREGFEC